MNKKQITKGVILMNEAIEFNDEQGLNFDMFCSDNVAISSSAMPGIEAVEKKKRGRPSKQQEVVNMVDSGNNTFVPVEQQQPLNFVYSNQSYDTTYNDTNAMLRTTVSQLDIVTAELKNQMDIVAASKTIKNKYQYIPQMAGSIGGLLATKVQAIKEINKTTTDAHNLELKRIKDLNLNVSADQKDDDQRIMEMYHAFISAPYGNQAGVPYTPQQLSTIGAPSPTGSAGIIRALEDPNTGFSQYQQHMSPEQNAMRLEHNPSVKTVVVYDKNTGNRYFDVMDINTHQSVPNVSRPDAMFLEDTTIDVRNRIARNTNLNQTYPLIIIGDNLDQY